MKLLHFLLAAALALPAQSADAASRHRKGAVKPQSVTSDRSPAQGSNHYYVPRVTDWGGNPRPIMQVPGSVVVIPRQVIDDQQDFTVCGALRNVSGVSCR